MRGQRCALVTPPSSISPGMRPNFTPRPLLPLAPWKRTISVFRWSMRPLEGGGGARWRGRGREDRMPGQSGLRAGWRPAAAKEMAVCLEAVRPLTPGQHLCRNKDEWSPFFMTDRPDAHIFTFTQLIDGQWAAVIHHFPVWSVKVSPAVRRRRPSLVPQWGNVHIFLLFSFFFCLKRRKKRKFFGFFFNFFQLISCWRINVSANAA